MSKQAWIILIVVIVVIAGLGLFFYNRQNETPASAPAPEIPAEYQDIAKQAVQIVASTLHVSPDEVTVVSVQKVTWSDASLGCPDPDMMYAQQLTPGYLVVTQVNGNTQNVHLNNKGKGLVCPDDRAKPPARIENP